MIGRYKDIFEKSRGKEEFPKFSDSQFLSASISSVSGSLLAYGLGRDGGCRKMFIPSARDDILRNEPYFSVRRSDEE
jgi:hypothetical protein